MHIAILKCAKCTIPAGYLFPRLYAFVFLKLPNSDALENVCKIYCKMTCSQLSSSFKMNVWGKKFAGG